MRHTNNNFDTVEELLDLRQLVLTTGEDTFKELMVLFHCLKIIWEERFSSSFRVRQRRIEACRDCGLSFREIVSRVGRNQQTVMRICDFWMQQGTTDRRGRSHPPQCPTSREDRQIVRMAVTDFSVTSRTVAHHIESNASFSVYAYHSTPFTAEWSVRKTSIAWSTLDAEAPTSPPPTVRLKKDLGGRME
ncbi:HTH_38 domain-containing protein [Trichonephila clavipes]|nr:HTH_38 domain-containing protein [Trichonephila clavipes]